MQKLSHRAASYTGGAASFKNNCGLLLSLDCLEEGESSHRLGEGSLYIKRTREYYKQCSDIMGTC
jgi:hypothetical protein